MRRYFVLFWLQLRTSILLAAQYRWDFLVDGVISLFWVTAAVVPLFVVYGNAAHAGIPGWSFGEALVVSGWFVLLQGVLDGAINPGLAAVIDHIRKGTLDFVLLKPADGQFLVSTARYHVFRVFSIGAALIIFVTAFRRLGTVPSLTHVLQALVLLVAAVLILYSMWILIVSSAFLVVKVDNLTYLFSSVFDAARWPSSVFRGVWHIVFTFIIPIAVMTTFPAEALLGRMSVVTMVGTVIGAVLFSIASRQVWLRAIGHYTSAGG
ncbi:MAG: ABC-2 family transporter protein [Archangium sp.]|nr:ABC-2 family transporter protein [Archangium sp.]